jgi:leucyl/phenylalanyl-tRNA--protein transferase
MYPMPVFLLSEDIAFPPPELAEPDGLLAVGGDLSVKRLLEAYRRGIFPWYSEGTPILWWSPDPRLVLFPREVKISRSLRQTLRKGAFAVSMDRAFAEVIGACAGVHGRRDGSTWITREMREAYTRLHEQGHAHSVEAWTGGHLAGGLYGVALGGAFFGESMFSLRSDASKVALLALAGHLERWGFDLIDCQVSTEHLKRMGAREIPRRAFLSRLGRALRKRSRPGCWAERFDPALLRAFAAGG